MIDFTGYYKINKNMILCEDNTMFYVSYAVLYKKGKRWYLSMGYDTVSEALNNNNEPFCSITSEHVKKLFKRFK